MKKKFFLALYVLILVMVITGIYNITKPLPDGLSLEGTVYNVPESSVAFFYDTTYIDTDGVRRTEQTIFDEVIKMIKEAEEYIVVDMFLFNDFQGKNPETTRLLSDELTNALILKKKENQDINILVISDPINTVYGGQESHDYNLLRENNIDVVITDLTKFRDSNPIYSSFWRIFPQWIDIAHTKLFGKSYTFRIFPNPLMHNGNLVTARSYLRLLNFKANHRKLIITDRPVANGKKISTLVTSANPHDGSSAHSNVAIRVDDYIWQDAIKSENSIVRFSKGDVFLFSNTDDVIDETGSVEVQFLTEGKIRSKLLQIIGNTDNGDQIDMVMFYLSDMKVIDALIDASLRGVDIRIVLDPNKDAFGYKKNGIPNRPVAQELVKKSSDNIQIRWCDTHGEQCHSKIILIHKDNEYSIMLGSANFTKRNIGDYNLEANILVKSDFKIDAIGDAYDYFELIWENKDGNIYTVDYEKYKDTSFRKFIQYMIMEKTGLSSF